MSTSGSADLRIRLHLLDLETAPTAPPVTAVVLWRRLQGPSGPVSVTAIGLAGTDIRKLLSDEQLARIEGQIDTIDQAARRSP